jgi:hypothetical protein
MFKLEELPKQKRFELRNLNFGFVSDFDIRISNSLCYTSVLCFMQLSICSRRFRSNPTITSLHAEMTGTLRAPEIFTISSNAARSLVTSYSVNL